jgi:DNA-binding response OmpR family regulator
MRDKLILVVEDEEELRNNIVKILTILGLKTLVACNGEEGLNVALKENIDLIVSDIKMPKKDGYEMLSELKKVETKENIPFIFLTSNIDREQVRKGMNIGADDYLTKPFNIQELTESIKTRFEKQGKLDVFYENKFKEIMENLKTKITTNILSGLPNIEEFNNKIEKIKNDFKETDVYILLNIEIDGSNEIRNFFSQGSLKNLQNDMINKIKINLTPKDFIYHINDLEFLILLDENKENFEFKNIESYAQMILESIKEPFITEEIEFNVSASIGISYAKEDKSMLDNLLKNSQTTKVFVQNNGGNNFKIHTKEIQQIVSTKLVNDLKKHIELKQKNLNLERKHPAKEQPYETKIFFLYPQDILQNQLIREIVANEYAAYIIKDHEKVKKILKRYPNSILFVNIDAVLSDQQWEDYIKEIQTNPDFLDTRIGILSHYNDIKKEEYYLMELLVPCGFVKLKTGLDESLNIILKTLDAIEARGKRKFVRVRTLDDKNVSGNIRINSNLYKCFINDISSIGMAFGFEQSEEIYLREGATLDDIQLLLKGNICHISGKVTNIRDVNGKKIYVAAFDKDINYKEKEKIYNFIFKFLQDEISREIEELE